MAAVHWARAVAVRREQQREFLPCNERKRTCYQDYAKAGRASCRKRSGSRSRLKLPAWLHLAAGYSGGKLPLSGDVPGMDSFRRSALRMAIAGVARIAVLALDGRTIRKARSRNSGDGR